MLAHYREAASGGYEIVVSRGTTPLKESAFTALKENIVDYRYSPADKSNIAKYVFSGFARCLYDVQKFQSDSERQFAVILDRDAIKWMKPAKGQFQIHYRAGVGHAEYQPDFVVETDAEILMVEVKARNELDDPEVLAKKAVALKWCGHATEFSTKHGGKPWRYVLVPHDAIAENVSLAWLTDRFGVRESPVTQS
jgi:type III restriction enzyme